MTTSKQIFTEAQQLLLTSALNRIVPAEGKMPGAGDLGVLEFVEKVVAPDPKLRRLDLQLLAMIVTLLAVPVVFPL